MVSFLHTPRSCTASLSSVRFIPDIVCISSIHFFLGRPLFLLPSPHASIIFFCIPFGNVYSHHMAKEHHLLLCCPLSQRQNSSSLWQLVRSPSVSTRLFSSLSKGPLASFSGSTFRRHQFPSPFLLPLSMSRNHTASPER